MNNKPYKAVLTREQFLFNEMKVTAKLKLSGLNDKEIEKEIKENNLFQYPTEKMLGNLSRVCLSRLNDLEDERLIRMIAEESSEVAKQVCLYSMMKSYRIVWEFMITVIGEKYRIHDYYLEKMDMNVFFTRLQEQNDAVALWSDSTIQKIKQVIFKILIETGYLDSLKSTKLNRVLIDLQLKDILMERKEKAELTAFNCFGGM